MRYRATGVLGTARCRGATGVTRGPRVRSEFAEQAKKGSSTTTSRHSQGRWGSVIVADGYL